MAIDHIFKGLCLVNPFEAFLCVGSRVEIGGEETISF
jgi:hypothetical protein